MKKVLFMVFGLLLSMAFTACSDDKDDEIPTNRYTLLVTSTTYNYDNNEELSKAVEAMLDKYRTEGIYIDGTQAEATALWRQACNEMLLFSTSRWLLSPTSPEATPSSTGSTSPSRRCTTTS